VLQRITSKSTSPTLEVRANALSLCAHKRVLCATLVALGEYEPFFCRMALFNQKTKKRLSEDFHFDLNSDSMRFFMREQEEIDKVTTVCIIDYFIVVVVVLVLPHFNSLQIVLGKNCDIFNTRHESGHLPRDVRLHASNYTSLMSFFFFFF
jgi:hypothetical protein